VLENVGVIEVLLVVLSLFLLRQVVLIVRRGWRSR
jgi:hypothetical protein